MSYALIHHMYLQIKADGLSQTCTCTSDVNEQVKYSKLATPSTMPSQHESY